MSAEATAAMASAPDAEMIEVEVAKAPADRNDNDTNAVTYQTQQHSKPIGLHSPPDSNSAMKLDGSDDSELSDLDDPSLDINVNLSPPPPSPLADHDNAQVNPQEEEEEDIGEVEPAEWSGTVPVFRPDMHQFKDFKKFMTKVDRYGMKSGIIKIIPPKEWTDNRSPLDDMVKQIKVREPIKQDIMGSNGTYRQVNILHQRSYNIPQWRQLCDQSEHQPPARRGERRAQAPPKPKPASSSAAAGSKGRRRTTRSRAKRGTAKDGAADQEDRPMTPISPKPNEDVIESVEQDPGMDVDEDDDAPPVVGRMGGSRQSKPKTQSTSARRKYARREASARIDEEAFRDFDYRMDISDYTPERCEELERIYWKTLTYAPPLYGADLPGTLFEEDCDVWNLNKLPNLLDVLGTKVPGVNTAYLYLGMWKATFAWHLEDVDLYSINYLHFGAPKQWYSISQGDARRFEAAMKSIWPTEAKACDQFLRHKAFLISPNHLLQYFNIKVNKCVSYPGEFVVTYPYGYHSGYNLGYNCAEAVNFALDSWMPMGRIAKRCECAQAQDSVWVDVYEIERKLRGEETEYEETDDEEEEEEDDDDLETGVPTPPSSHIVRIKQPGQKRKRPTSDKGQKKAKKIRLRVKNHVEPPCCLCPHDIPGQEVLPTSDGRKAHRICALYGPETWIETVEGEEIVNAESISKARLELKCLYCRSKRGACFQCSQKKCARSYHATCAAAAGVLVEEADVPIFGEDGTEYKERAYEFSCRFHRTKRERKLDGDALDDCQKTRQSAADLKKGDICQLQYYRGEIFAGVVAENRADEQTLLVDVIPNGDRVEVEWKWLLLPDPSDFHLQRASANAIPMPTSRKAKDKINATKRVPEELPRADAPFVDGFTWAEFNAHECTNKAQAKVDFTKENQIWHYLGRTSTEARAQYTEDPRQPKHNPKSNFLDTLPRPALPAVQPRKSYGSTFSLQTPSTAGIKPEKPYQYKPRAPTTPSYAHSPYTAQQFVPKPSPFTTQQFIPTTPHYASQQQAPGPVPLPRQNAQYIPHQVTPKPTVPLQPSGQHHPQQNLPQPGSIPAPQNNHHYSSQGTLQPASTPQQNGQYTPQPTVPKPTSVTRPTPAKGGHTRNRSSLSGQNGQPLAFGSDHRFRTPPFSYGTSRIDSVAKSPFSHGFMQPPGLGPAPSPQNGQLFQAQARARSSSLASNRSFDTPMTSSAIRPPSSASAKGTIGDSQTSQQQSTNQQPRPSIVQKYAFFQVHHNRDSTKYRTPYAHWGGFTNGYEGNLRAHLMRSPEALFSIRRQSTSFSPSASSQSPAPRNPFSNGVSSSHDSARRAASSSYASPGPFGAAQKMTPSPSPAMPRGRQESRAASMDYANTVDLDQGSAAQLHPAIRASYAAMLQRTNTEPHIQQHYAGARAVTPSQHPALAASPSLTYPHTSNSHAPSASPVNTELPQRVENNRTPQGTADQKLPTSTTSNSSAKTTPPVRQTYIPAPRPWENCRKIQTPTHPVQSIFPYNPMTSAVATPATNSTTPSPFVYDGPGNTRHLASLAPQPSNAKRDISRAVPVQLQQPTAVYPLPTEDAQSTEAGVHEQSWSDTPAPSAVPSAVSAVLPAAVPAAVPAGVPAAVPAATPAAKLMAVPTTPIPLASPATTSTNDLPEVPDESMELIESIIMNARRVSDSYSDSAAGNV
ncbi:hypothetical protein GGR53DRAFT_474427 [Hypoxylon sp. FL1150]|nr:hypothetical protein GGR53DRAFT_474427 [Hypoxylon sp. FL1150]